MSHHRPRLIGQLLLGTRHAAAVLVQRHPDLVRRRCEPVACDVGSRALLYDLEAVDDALRGVQRREGARQFATVGGSTRQHLTSDPR